MYGQIGGEAHPQRSAEPRRAEARRLGAGPGVAVGGVGGGASPEAAARLRGARRRPRSVRSVVHVSPAQFSDDSIVGGGERAARDLARAVAARVPTTMVTFGTRRESRRDGDLRVEIYPARRFLNARYDRYDPLGYGHLRALASADVIHCHQYRVAVSQLAILGAAALGRRTFVTDRGGVGCHFDPPIPVAR